MTATTDLEPWPAFAAMVAKETGVDPVACPGLGLDVVDAVALYRVVHVLEAQDIEPFPEDLLDVLDTFDDLHHFYRVRCAHRRPVAGSTE